MNAAHQPQALLVIATPQHDATAYHLSGFWAPDPVVCIVVGGKSYLVVGSMEYRRASEQAWVDEVLSLDEVDGIQGLIQELGGHDERVLAAAAVRLLTMLGVHAVVVPPNLGILYADRLRSHGIEVRPDGKVFDSLRRTKTEEELAHIEKTQRAVESVCAYAIRVLQECEPAADGTLHRDGEPLTSEVLRSEMGVELLRHRCSTTSSIIVAGGSQASDPHEKGRGPLQANKPIILDIFPMNLDNRYHADMTRTVVRGNPNDKLERMYNAVLESQETALAMIRAGINGRDVHRTVCEVLHDAGYKTLIHDQKEGIPLREGFIHGTGHGVGLDIHEGPRLSLVDEYLAPGDVVTVEPGLYEPNVGGVRIEDLVVVTEDGCRNLTNFPKQFQI